MLLRNNKVIYKTEQNWKYNFSKRMTLLALPSSLNWIPNPSKNKISSILILFLSINSMLLEEKCHMSTYVNVFKHTKPHVPHTNSKIWTKPNTLILNWNNVIQYIESAKHRTRERRFNFIYAAKLFFSVLREKWMNYLDEIVIHRELFIWLFLNSYPSGNPFVFLNKNFLNFVMN